MAGDSPDSKKPQQHLNLLREQYINLHNNYIELQQKYNVAIASRDNSDFIGRLLKTIGNLYNNQQYSDLTIKLKDTDVPAHKFVLSARSDFWSNLDNESVLNWKDFNEKLGSILLKWIYTDTISQEHLTLDLMKVASGFQLKELVERCENCLIGTVKLQDCVKLYTVAEELGTEKLRDHCSSLISSHWDDLTGEDFKEMPGPLLYQLLKAKSHYPLHSAVRLQREDVVFLYLIEHNSELSEAVNAVDQKGETALEVALKSRQPQLARTLVEHRADLGAKDSSGLSLLHSAILKGDSYSAEFIVEQLEKFGPSSPTLSETISVTDGPKTEGSSALHLLASHEGPDMLAVAIRLLRAGVNPNIQCKKGLTALHNCVLRKNIQMIELLIKEADGLDLEKRNFEGETPLGLALRMDEEPGPISEILLSAGADANPVYDYGEEGLIHRLAREGREEAALFLLKRCPRLSENSALLQEACKSGLERLVKQILKEAPSGLVTSKNAKSETALHLAVSSGRVGLVKVLLESTDPKELIRLLNAENEDGETPLSLEISSRRSGSQKQNTKEILSLLISAGADVDQRNEAGQTLLHQAILREDSATAIFLLENGANINARMDPGGETPLQLCVHCRLPDVVEALCRRGVDALTGCPLWDALDSDQQDVASILVTHGADPDCWSSGPDGCIQTLLHRAIDENKEEIAQFLIRSGCDLNSPRKLGLDGAGGDIAREESSPLHMCCQWGLEQVVQTLIEHGANVNSRDAEGKTPVHVAIQNQHTPIISLLLCHPNINLSIRDKKGQSPFATALTVRNNKAAQAILEKLPSAAEQFDNKGRNFLHTAIQKNDMESILFLLSIQVDVNSRVQDDTKIPPLHLASISGNEMLVRSLILAGARVNDTDAHRNTALHSAAKAGHPSVVSALLQNGINFDSVNADGDNALHVAVKEGHIAVVRTLLTECTLDAEAVNLKGRNPLHELARYGRDNAATICELFFECMAKYPLNNADLDGNTPLLIAYMKGNGNLCRTLVKHGACLGSMNKDGITIFNYQVATKQLLYRLLESLTEEAPWTDKDHCLECGTKFTLTMRKHHCRHCGRILCSKCSGQDVPILKFGQNKPVRVCAVCFDVLQVGAD